MKKTIHKSFAILLLLVISLGFAQPVFAHGGEPRLEISAERLNPGAVLEIRGVDFEFEEEITLSLIGPETDIPISTVAGDTEGIFQYVFALPVDLTEGTYMIRATTDDHVVDSPQITVFGAPLMQQGGQGPRDEEDGLLAPMPTTIPGSPTQQLSEMALPVEDAQPVQNSSPFIYWLAAGVGIILIAGLIRIRKK